MCNTSDFEDKKMWNASRFCASSLRRGHANLLCIVPILVYVFSMEYIVDRFFHTIFGKSILETGVV